MMSSSTSFSYTLQDDKLSLTIPAIPLPFIGTTEKPLHISVSKSQLQTALRLVVIISTYILFRPHLEKLFRRVTGQEGLPPTQAEVQARMAKIEAERGTAIGGGRKEKKVAVVTTTGADEAIGGTGTKSRRKA